MILLELNWWCNEKCNCNSFRIYNGKGLGLNANASIITRGLSEIIDLGIKMGAKKTFYGLSGIGDLSLTCSSLKSRNTKLGYLLAKRKKGFQEKLLREWNPVRVYVL